MKLGKKKMFALAATGLVGALYLTSALAKLPYSTDTVYYSDASFSSQVGEVTVSCNGSKSTVGVVTAFSQLISKESCGGGGYECPPANPVCFTSTTPAEQGAMKRNLHAVRPEDRAFAA